MQMPALREEIALFEGARGADGQPGWTLHDPVRNLFFQLDWTSFELLSRWHLGTPAALLADLQAHTTLQADDATLHPRLNGGLVNLDKGINSVITSLGQIGARFNRVESMRDAAEGQLLNLANNLSEVEDIDLPKTIVDLQMQEVAYKAALGATARVVQPSLLDFLR